MRRGIVGLAALLVYAAGGGQQLAVAADIPMPVKARPYAVAPAFNWTGFYVGGHVGYGWARKEWTDPLGPPFDAGAHTATGWLGGVQAGYNYQIGSVVLGIEGTYSWAKLKGSHINPLEVPPVDVLETKVHSIATAAGRIGYAFDRALIYAKGGAAWIKDSYAIIDLGIIEGIAQETRTGWLAGAGVEYAFWQNWSARLEYNYMDFGTRRVNFIDPGAPAGTPTTPFDIRQRVQTLTLGVNYRFSGPIMSKF
jgi:outer membrane immunogenic protein